jgi:transcriptional regulator NrdR family protein
MKCPECDNRDMKILETRESGEWSISRRRKCNQCGARWWTTELMDVRVIELYAAEERLERAGIRE